MNRPDWLAPEAARAIAQAAGAVLARRNSPEEAKAAVRAAAVACLPAMPAPMLAEAAAAMSPAEAPAPEHELPGLAPVGAAELAERLGVLACGANLPPGAAAEGLAARLASAGAERLRRS